jgi:hypothetical protein
MVHGEREQATVSQSLRDSAWLLKSNRLEGGSSSAVERQLPKLDVAGSIPVSRSIPPLIELNRTFNMGRLPRRIQRIPIRKKALR